MIRKIRREKEQINGADAAHTRMIVRQSVR
jgi:hypothetical protein